MEQLKLILAFGVGCLTALMLGFGPDVTRVFKVPSVVAASEPGMLESRFNALEERAAELEQAATRGQASSKVVAPFEVVDAAKRRIFYVEPDNTTSILFSNKKEAFILGSTYGGSFEALSASGNLEARLGAQPRGNVWGISVSDNYKDRIALGRDAKAGTPDLSFFSVSGQVVAGIGESTDTHEAAALVFDKSGNLRARMAITTDGKGLVDVLGANKVPIAQLTESDNGGGKLWIGNAGGVGMVEAGDAGDYGIVRVGPEGFKFIPTPGLALPGTVIVGKR